MTSAGWANVEKSMDLAIEGAHEDPRLLPRQEGSSPWLL